MTDPVATAPGTDRSPKQMVYRVGVPVGKVGGNNVGASFAQSLFGHGRSNSNRSHTGPAPCFDSGRGVFNHNTFRRQQRQLSISAAPAIQQAQGPLVAVRRGLVIET